MPEDEWRDLALAWRAAAARYGARDAAQRLQSTWGEGALQARGVRSTIPETDEVVEIPASEAGRLTFDCPRSRIVLFSSRGRRKLTHYHSVQVRTAVYERPPQQAGENGALAATAARQSQLAEQADDEQPAREGETDASPPRREDANASVKEAEASAPVGEPPMAQADVELPEPKPEPEQPPQNASTAKPRARKASRRVKGVADFLFNEWAERPPTLSVGEMRTFVLTKTRSCGMSTVERAIQWLEEQGKWGK